MDLIEFTEKPLSLAKKRAEETNTQLIYFVSLSGDYNDIESFNDISFHYHKLTTFENLSKVLLYLTKKYVKFLNNYGYFSDIEFDDCFYDDSITFKIGCDEIRVIGIDQSIFKTNGREEELINFFKTDKLLAQCFTNY